MPTLPMPILTAVRALPALALLAGGSLAQAATPAAAPSPLALSCMACHQPAVDAATMPSLARREARAIAASLRAARDDPQRGSIMARFAEGLNDAEIEALAAELGRPPERADR